MPKQRITKETVVKAAFEIAREGGMEQVMVKNIAERIGCSVQPIYSYCRNMERLKREVAAKVKRFTREYAAARVDRNDIFRSTGRAYIQLAKEEPQLFKIFILHERDGIASLDELYETEAGEGMADRIAGELGLSAAQARELHLNMLIYTIGLGTIFSVTRPGITAEEIYERQESAYEVFLKHAEEKSKAESAPCAERERK